jgi:hypothetical protein
VDRKCSCGPEAHMKQNMAIMQILAMQFIHQPETWPIFERWAREVSGATEFTISELVKRPLYSYVIGDTARQAMNLIKDCTVLHWSQENSP